MASIGARVFTRQTRARYSCDECALRNVTLDVPPRTDPDVNAWVTAIRLTLQADHWTKTPGCPGVIEVVIGC
jgi:hypothetical protein